MPSFEYEATTPEGQRVRNVAFGQNLQDVVESLIAQGMVITHIRDAYSQHDVVKNAEPAPSVDPMIKQVQSEAPARKIETPAATSTRPAPNLNQRNTFLTNIFGPIFLKAPLKDMSFFFRQLGTMIEAGVPLVQATDTLASQSTNPKLKGVLNEVRNAVDSGYPISAVLQRYPEMFSPLVISLLRAGEEGGFLAPACLQISDYLNHDLEIKNMYRRETFLPKMYLGICILIVGAANLILGSLNAPGLNAPLNNIAVWYFIIPIALGIFLFFTVGTSFYGIRLAWDRFKLRIPYVGKTSHHFAMSKFGRAFGALHKGGVPITKSVHLAADASGNEHIRGSIYPAMNRIQEGEPISQTLADTGVFSPIVLNMMSTGETTGNLDGMLIKAAEYYEDEGKVRARQMAVVIGVLVLLAVLIYIGYIVISFWMSYSQGMQNAFQNA